jgi:hypothetical protein
MDDFLGGAGGVDLGFAGDEEAGGRDDPEGSLIRP